jgi:hypothetical protein
MCVLSKTKSVRKSCNKICGAILSVPQYIFMSWCLVKHRDKSRDSSVGIATGYGLDDRMIRVRFPAGAGNFSLLYRVQTGSGDHSTYYPMCTRGSFPGGKTAGA